MGNHDHYDSIIQLLSVSVTEDPEDENVKKFLEKDLTKYIVLVIKNSSWFHDRYIPCLNLISSLSNASPLCADKFMDNYVQTNLIK